MYAMIELTTDIELAIPQRFRNNHWPAGTRFYVRQEKPDYGMVVCGSHPDAGIGVPPEAAKIIQVFDSYREMIEAQKKAKVAEEENSSYTLEEMDRINEMEMWGPQGRPQGRWL